MNYKVTIDTVPDDLWERYAKEFADYSLYQTSAYQRVRAENEGQELSRAIVLDDIGEVVMMCHLRIKHIKPIGLRVGYVQCGPLWRRRGKKTDHEIFRRMIRVLYDEYVSKRGAVLRLAPNEFENTDETLRQILKEEGYQRQSHAPPYRTILNDLSSSLEELKKGLHKSWRKNLNRAIKNNLQVLEGTDDSLYTMFTDIYRQMRSRKKFSSGADIYEFGNIQKCLSDTLKMNIMICKSKEQPLAALVWSALGDTGIPLFSATSNEGLKSYGAYLLMWHFIVALKERGCRFLDQGGINPQLNPGGYEFKAGMGGFEASHIGQFDAYNSKVKHCFVSCAERLRNCSRGAREKLKRLLKVRISSNRT